MKTVGIGWEGSSARRLDDADDIPGAAWDQAVEEASHVRGLFAAQREVYALFLEFGDMTDPEMISRARKRYITQSESGLRTRRAELVRKGLLADSEERRSLPTGRRARVWACSG